MHDKWVFCILCIFLLYSISCCWNWLGIYGIYTIFWYLPRFCFLCLCHLLMCAPFLLLIFAGCNDYLIADACFAFYDFQYHFSYLHILCISSHFIWFHSSSVRNNAWSVACLIKICIIKKIPPLIYNINYFYFQPAAICGCIFISLLHILLVLKGFAKFL